jgi:hypothetical protein
MATIGDTAETARAQQHRHENCPRSEYPLIEVKRSSMLRRGNFGF